MKALLITICLYHYGKGQKQLFPDISDLFQTLSEDPFDVKELQNQGVYVRNVTLDIEKLDVSRIRRRLEDNTTFSLPFDLNDTRRFPRIGKRWQYRHATKVATKIKCVDIMLEIIYMARHKLRELESQKFFNPKDTSYRIAFLYRRLRRIWRRLMDIFNTMWYNRDKKKRPWNNLTPLLILHHKAAKKHVDFLYLWWVQVKLHEKYCQAHGIPNIVPDN